jgi:hypothetical protein
MDFGEILTKAWKVIWKHKILWLFGVLAGCSVTGGYHGGGGGGGSSAASSGGSGFINTQNGYTSGPSILAPSTQRAFEDFFRWLGDIPVWIWIGIALGVLALIIIISVAIILLGNLGLTGVIKGAGMADGAAEDEKPISFKAIFKAIKPYYWKVLLLTIGFNIAGLIVGVVLAVPIVLFTVCTCFLGLFLLVPIGWFVNTLVYFSAIAIIEEDQKIFDAIGRGWELMTRHLGKVALMFLILGVLQIIFGFVIFVPMIFIPVPLLVNLITTGFAQVPTIGLILSGILMLVIVPIMIFLGGVLRAYVLTNWTLTYHRLAEASPLEPEVISEPKAKKSKS